MYLFVWRDGTARQVEDNLTVTDYLAVAQGLLAVYRHDPDRHAYARLCIDRGRACWVPVKQGKALTSPDAKIHL